MRHERIQQSCMSQINMLSYDYYDLEGPKIRFIKKVRQLETKRYCMSQSESSGTQKVITLDNFPQNIKEIRLFFILTLQVESFSCQFKLT